MTEVQLAGMDLPGLLELAEQSTDPLVRELAKRMPDADQENERYEDGFDDGKAEGYADGYADGKDEGYNKGFGIGRADALSEAGAG